MNRSPIRWRPLLALTTAVLAGHVLLLRPLPGVFQPARERPRALLTRTVSAEPAATPVAVASPAPAIAAPERPRSTAPGLEPGLHRADTQSPVRALNAPSTADAAQGPSPKLPSPRRPPAVKSLAFAVPRPVLLHYKVTVQTRGLMLNGQGRLHWRHDGSEYDARLELSGGLLPSRTQQSSGRITAHGLAPLRFSDKARSEEAAHFQREEGKVSFSSNRPDALLAAGAQDRLSVMLQLGAMIAGKPENFQPGATISIQTASTRDAEVWQFTVEGQEALELPGGTLNALKLIRNPRKEFDQKIELWLAPGMDYVPVRLRLTQPNGDWVDQQWSSTDKG